MALVDKETTHISLSKAWGILREKCRQLPLEPVPVHGSLGRILGEDVIAGRNVPHYNASAMDGYALSSALTAGAVPSSPVSFPAGEYEWVNTGAEISPRFDSVVMIEDTSLDEKQASCRLSLPSWREKTSALSERTSSSDRLSPGKVTG